MARSVGTEIPEAIRPLFNGEDLASREGLTFSLLTATPDGWPHLAMLSVGEVVAVDARTLRVALWRKSTAEGNLSPTGRATLTLVHGGAGYSLRCSAVRGEDIETPSGHGLSYFELRVEEAFEDVAPYADLTGGITYKLKVPASVFPRWRSTVDAMLAREPLTPATPVTGGA